jgi:hypothetical protein
MQDTADTENGGILDMHHDGNYEELSSMDNSLQRYNEN